MARYKTIKPNDYKYELLKKRDRIRITADAIYVSLMLLGILICGINQFNNAIVGWGMIAMGIISVPAAVFHIYIDKNKWGALFWYDTPELKSYYINSKQREKDLSELRFLRAIETVSLVAFSIVLPVLGLLSLLEFI